MNVSLLLSNGVAILVIYAIVTIDNCEVMSKRINSFFEITRQIGLNDTNLWTFCAYTNARKGILDEW